MSRLRVLVVTPDFPPAIGGIQLLVHALVDGLTRFERRVVTLEQPEGREWDAGWPEVPVLRVAPGALPHPARVAVLNARGVAAGLRFRPDVVLSAHIVASPAAAALGRAVGAPFVQLLYAKEVVDKPRLASFAVRHASDVIAISRHTASMARACGADPGRLHVVAPGVDPAPVGARREADARPTILTLARLINRYKGHDVMLRALPLVRARVPDVRWIVAGDGPLLGPLRRAADLQGLDGAVEFVEGVSDARREELFARSWVFAMPSRLSAGRGGGGGEGFGIVFLEAAARGLPVVAGAVGGALDAVEHGTTGLLVDPHDHVALARALTDLLSDRALARRLGDAGVRHARGFSWPIMADRVAGVLETAAP